MREAFRRIGAMILALCLLVSVLSVSVLAEDGTEITGIQYTVSGYSCVYDGKAHSISVNVISPEGASVSYAYPTEGKYGSQNPAFTNAGEYKVAYMIAKESYATQTDIATVAIERADVSDAVESTLKSSFTYDGDPVQFAPFHEGIESWEMAYCDADGTSLSDAPSDPGSYSVKISGYGANYYAHVDHSFTIDEPEKEIEYSVESFDVDYDGKPHSISLTVSTEGVTVSYATAYEGPYGETNPSFTEAGMYVVYYKLEKQGYKSEEGSVTVEIHAIDISDDVKATLPGSFTCTGAPVQFNLPTDKIQEWSVEYCQGDLSLESAPSAPGSYTAAISGESGNYRASISHSFTIVEAEALPVIQYSVSGYSGYYDGQAHSIVLNIATEGVTATFATSEDSAYTATQPSFTEPGEYTVWFRLEKEGYETVVGSASVTIKELAQIDYSVQGFNGYYDGKAHTIALNIATEGVTATFATSEDGTYTATQPSFTEPGEYTVWFRLEKENCATVTGSASVTIMELAQIDYTVQGFNGNYDGKAHTIALNIATEGVTATFASSEDSAYTATQPSFTEPGEYTVRFRLEKEGYETVTGSASVTIMELAQIDYTVQGFNGYYDGKAHTIALNVATEGVTATFASSEDSAYTATQPSFTEPGEYTVWFRLEKEGYETKYDFGVVEIRQADIEYSVKGYTGQYNGKPHSISLDVKTPGAAVTYATSRDGTYTAKMPGFTEPGEYTVWFKIEKNDHTSVLDSETVTIKPGQIHYTVSDYKGVYDGEGHSITLSVLTPGAKVTYSVENALALNLPTFSSDNPSFVDAGTFKVRYWIEKHGYETVNGSATVTIEKAEQKLYFEKSVNVLKLVDLDKLYAEFRFFCEQGAGVVTVSSSSGIIQALYQASDPSELSRYALYFSADVETPVTVTATAAETTNYKAATATCVFVRSDEIEATFDATLNVRDAQFIGRNDGKKQTLKTEELDLTIRPLSDRDDKSLLGASLKLWKKLMDSVGASLIGSMAVDVALFDNQTGMEVHNVSGDLTLMLTGVLQQKYQENYKEMACYAVHIKQDSTTGSTAASTGTSTNGQGVNIDSQGFNMSGGTIDSTGTSTNGQGVYSDSPSFNMSGGTLSSSNIGSGNGSLNSSMGTGIGGSGSSAGGSGMTSQQAGSNASENSSGEDMDAEAILNALKDKLGSSSENSSGEDMDAEAILNALKDKLGSASENSSGEDMDAEAILNTLKDKLGSSSAGSSGEDMDAEAILNALKDKLGNASENSSGMTGQHAGSSSSAGNPSMTAQQAGSSSSAGGSGMTSQMAGSSSSAGNPGMTAQQAGSSSSAGTPSMTSQMAGSSSSAGNPGMTSQMAGSSSSAGNPGMTAQQAGSSSSAGNPSMTAQQAGSSSSAGNPSMTAQQAGSSSSAGNPSMTAQQAGSGSSTSKKGALGSAVGSLSPNVEIIPCQMTSSGVRVPGTSLSPFLLIYGPKEAFSNLLTVRAKDGVFTWDGESHAVAAEPSIVEGTTLWYSLDLENWQSDAPAFTDVLWNEDGSVGSWQVYVLAENPGCDPAVCSYTVTILPEV